LSDTTLYFSELRKPIGTDCLPSANPISVLARLMAVPVVVVFEVVDINQKQSEGLYALTILLFGPSRQFRVKVPSIEQAGKRINISEPFQFRFVRFPTLLLVQARVDVADCQCKQGLTG
jgi:hypothetical protein